MPFFVFFSWNNILNAVVVIGFCVINRHRTIHIYCANVRFPVFLLYCNYVRRSPGEGNGTHSSIQVN